MTVLDAARTAGARAVRTWVSWDDLGRLQGRTHMLDVHLQTPRPRSMVDDMWSIDAPLERNGALSLQSTQRDDWVLPMLDDHDGALRDYRHAIDDLLDAPDASGRTLSAVDWQEMLAVAPPPTGHVRIAVDQGELVRVVDARLDELPASVRDALVATRQLELSTLASGHARRTPSSWFDTGLPALDASDAIPSGAASEHLSDAWSAAGIA